MLATIVALPLTAALSACGGSGGSSGSGSTSIISSTGDKAGRNATHITFWSALRDSQEVVDAFNRTRDTVQVDLQPDSDSALGTHGGSTFAVTASSEHPEAAPEFIE
ncbi:hypothetical protein [Streptomyces sp. NPDC058092]|uniref:hypothetical protein n=1 Tax=Streptomyces sp. NPDC058092 TaxID=3346336 RepID=UPI0036E90532